jgi:hypothetical protein
VAIAGTRVSTVRCLVFGSPRRLNLQLGVFYIPGYPEHWQGTPWTSGLASLHLWLWPLNNLNVIADLEHCDRICHIYLYFKATLQIENLWLWTAMQVPFPELEILRLSLRRVSSSRSILWWIRATSSIPFLKSTFFRTSSIFTFTIFLIPGTSHLIQWPLAFPC